MAHKIHSLNWMTLIVGRIKSRGIEIKTAIDIGANIGQWCQDFKSVFPDAEVLSIEAQHGCEWGLSQVNPNYKIALMGKENNDAVEFYAGYGQDVGGSIYPESTEWGATYQNPTLLPMITLDSLNQQFDWIKMDVQGAEWDIIKGGLATLNKGMFLQLELGVMKYNNGSKLFSEVVSYLHNIGYMLYDITDLFYIEENEDGLNKLAQMDCIFINEQYQHLLEVKG
jgi:FkbM family methyltransferase